VALGPNVVVRTLKTACTFIELRPTGPLVAEQGSNLLPYPSPVPTSVF
jgi:hypothetical protein